MATFVFKIHILETAGLEYYIIPSFSEATTVTTGLSSPN